MTQELRKYMIRIKGNLPDRWKDWFEGMQLTNLDNGEIQLTGCLQDQSELIGIINQIHNINLMIISINSDDG